ncbi:MAG: cyclic-di-AMP receptor [Anaerolineae bacterium]|nr:cyclic-di-AMP receptor [Anaerolineae bacterium]
MTKLLLAILPEELAGAAVEALTGEGFRVTRIASTGGFLRKGYVTLMTGTADERVEEAIALLRKACQEAAQARGGQDPAAAQPPRCGVTVFVLGTETFEYV